MNCALRLCVFATLALISQSALAMSDGQLQAMIEQRLSGDRSGAKR